MNSKILIYFDAIKRLFPFFFTADSQSNIVEFGPSLAKIVPRIKPGMALRDVFRPLSSHDLELLESNEGPTGTLCLFSPLGSDLILRGEFTPLDAGTRFFAGSPWIQDSADLNRLKLEIDDFAVHDPVLDLLNVIQSERMAKSEIHDLVRRLKTQQATLQKANETLEEQNRTILAAQGEILVTQAELKLKEAEARKLALVASRTTNAVIITDPKGHIEWANAGFERMTQFSLEEVVGTKPGELLQGSDSQAKEIAFMRKKIAKAEGFKTELINYTKSGQAYWVAIEVQPVFNKERQLTNFIGISTDITKDRKSKERLRLAKQKAEEANLSKSEFLSRMSHELRTPLNGILGFGELLKMSPLTTRQFQNVEHIIKAGDHLLDLINEVLDLSSIEAGALNLKMESVQIYHIIDEAIHLTQVLAKEREVVVTLETSIPRDLHIKADTQRIKQVLLNLISNAIKYNVQGGVVQVGAQKRTDSVWRFLVKDSGHGIPPDQMQNIFKPFVRIENNQSEAEGTGLGLALSKKLVEAMNGQIGVHSNQNQGCVFWLECEAITPQDQISGSHSQPHPNQLLLPDETHTGSVLYIENNLENLQLVEQVMEARPNVKLLSTMYGMHGLQMAREKQPDLVILDLHLPDCHGREVLRQIKQSEKSKNIHVIILSADAMNATIDEMRELGADQYLSKPLKVLNFLKTLDKFLPQTPSGGTVKP